MTEHAATLEWLSTGSAALDAILGGGIPAQSVTVIAGEPGSGKTVFTLQALFHHARQGKKCLYLTTLPPPPPPNDSHSRIFVYDLAVGMATWGTTTLLVGEYTPEDIGVSPEFAIADGIVRLTSERQELTTEGPFE